ncbi:MAG: hypothetical protein JXR63_09950 [Spirochaetales bacterium]|nr:hypothetical protein [Spirochaetales bacterium]
MDLKEIISSLDGKAVSLGHGESVEYGFSSDLMSDVLTLSHDKVVLLTGLATMQAVRTADMAGISCIVLVRNKKASELMIDVATEFGISIIETPFSLFRASAILCERGLKPCF